MDGSSDGGHGPVQGIDHIGIVLADPAPLLRLAEFLKATVRGPVVSPDGHVELTYLDLRPGVRIELVVPLTEHARAATGLDEHGPRLHHLGFRAPEVESTSQRFKDWGFEVDEPRPAVYDGRMAFTAVGSIIVELIEWPESVWPAIKASTS